MERMRERERLIKGEREGERMRKLERYMER